MYNYFFHYILYYNMYIYSLLFFSDLPKYRCIPSYRNLNTYMEYEQMCELEITHNEHSNDRYNQTLSQTSYQDWSVQFLALYIMRHVRRPYTFKWHVKEEAKHSGFSPLITLRSPDSARFYLYPLGKYTPLSQ